jgi:hypothetical protein
MLLGRNHLSTLHSIFGVRPLLFLLLLPALAGAVEMHVELSAKTAADFERAAKLVEAQYEAAIAGNRALLLVSDEKELLKRVNAGEVVTRKIADKKLKVQGALSHYWAGGMFDPDGTVEAYLKILLDYPRHKEYYHPEVTDSALVSHDGNHYQSHLRLFKKKVLTAVLDVDFESDLRRVDAKHIYLRTIATRIVEVQDAGKPAERLLPVGNDSGFLWRQNSYWSIREADGGVYVELASFSLSRSIPTGLGWIVRPFITSIPKDTIEKTLRSTRVAAH